MQQQRHDVRRTNRRRPPAGWPGLPAATRIAAAAAHSAPPSAGASPADPRDDLPRTGDLQIRILDRMVGILGVLVESQEHGGVDSDDLGLMSLLTADLDRHLTELMDARYEADDDDRVLAIERALVSVRARMGQLSEA